MAERLNIVIPFAGDPAGLRYTLRSICKHIPHDSLALIGDRPDWYGGDHISHKAHTNQAYKALDILDKTLKSPHAEFIRMCDDYIFTAPFDCFKYYSMCSLQELRDSKADGNLFRDIIDSTMRVIGNGPSLEQHCPMPMRLDVLQEIRKQFGWSRSNGYLIRSLHWWLTKPALTYRDDVVLHRGLPTGQSLFSVGCYNYTPEMYRYLDTTFPEPCLYEK